MDGYAKRAAFFPEFFFEKSLAAPFELALSTGEC
jgi:hypothetical protein